MRIGIMAVGSHGDVQPFVALGAGLRQAGYEVALASHESFRELSDTCGLEFLPVAGNPVEIVQGAMGQAWLGSNDRSGLFLLRLAQLGRSLIEELSNDLWKAGEGCDAIIYSLPLSVVGFSIAEARGVPGIPASLYPLHPSASFPSIIMPNFPFRGALANRATGSLVAHLYWLMIRAIHDKWRRRVPRLGSMPYLLASIRKQGLPYLYGYSPSVIPKPADWNGSQEVCGYWFLETKRTWSPPPALVDFIEKGEPPLYVGFGSMASPDAKEKTAAVLAALTRVGKRAILSSGWGGLAAEELPEGFFPVGFVPHDWLFPRVSAAIMHGGAGTTAMALRSGLPSIIVPFFADQFFWGRLIHDRGFGPAPIPMRRLTAPSLSAAIDETLGSPQIRKRTQAIAERIQKEDGVGAAVEVVDRYLR